jgi:hypothetical protein
MKHGIAKAAGLLVAGLVVLSAAMPAWAETPMRMNIPFGFLADGQKHPAGVYFITLNPDFGFAELRWSQSVFSQRLMLNGSVIARTGQDPIKRFVRFEKNGSNYTLLSVGSQAGVVAVRPMKSGTELAKANRGGTTVDVGATR